MQFPIFRLGSKVLAMAALVTGGFDIPVAHAGQSTDTPEAIRKAHEAATIRGAVERHEVLALPKVLALAQAAAPGEIVKVEVEVEHGRVIYEIKTLSENGRVREVELDARTGAVLKVEDD